MARRLFTIGYEGRSVDDLIEALEAVGVATVADVRLNPVSRRPGFSRRALEAALAGAGIGYVSERELGNPVDNRSAFHRRDNTAAVARVRAILDTTGAAALARLADLCAREPVALLCIERDHERCHRRVIADALQEIDPSLDVCPIP